MDFCEEHGWSPEYEFHPLYRAWAGELPYPARQAFDFTEYWSQQRGDEGDTGWQVP